MARTGNKNGRREGVALALASGKSIRAAAADCGVGERTIHSWLDTDPVFRARIDDLRSDLFGLAVGRLSDLSGKAADVLGGLLDSQSDTVRLQAARSVLEYGSRLREVTDLAHQIAELRRRIEAHDEQGPVSGTREAESFLKHLSPGALAELESALAGEHPNGSV